MNPLRITVPRLERPIADVLGRMPRSFRDQAEKGFTVLAGVGPQFYAEILQAVLVGLETQEPPLEELQKSLKLPPNDLSALFAAAMLTVPMLGQGIDGPEFIDGAVKQGIISQQTASKIKPFIDAVIAQSTPIGKAIRRTALPARVLPYVSNVDIAIDLRIGFEKGAVEDAVPVAVIHIDTDIVGQEIWFQASRQRMLQLKNDIDEALKQMEAAETWSQREPKP
jgi:hypothetical protein